MTPAPHDYRMRKAIKGIVTGHFDSRSTVVIYLDRHGAEKHRLSGRNANQEAVRKERERRVATGELGAVVHLAVALEDTARISMIEIIDEVREDPTVPNVHTIISWFDGEDFRHRWVPVPETAAIEWANVWGEGVAE